MNAILTVLALISSLTSAATGSAPFLFVANGGNWVKSESETRLVPLRTFLQGEAPVSCPTLTAYSASNPSNLVRLFELNQTDEEALRPFSNIMVECAIWHEQKRDGTIIVNQTITSLAFVKPDGKKPVSAIFSLRQAESGKFFQPAALLTDKGWAFLEKAHGVDYFITRAEKVTANPYNGTIDPVDTSDSGNLYLLARNAESKLVYGFNLVSLLTKLANEQK